MPSNPTFIRARELWSRPGRPGRLPVSQATGWRWVQSGRFPKPVELSPGITAWPIEAVEAWEHAKACQE